MKYEILPCGGGDAGFIEEQADKLADTIAPPEDGAEDEQYVYKVTDGEGNNLGGCVLNIDNWKSAAINDLWVDAPCQRQGIGTRLLLAVEREAKEKGAHVMLFDAFDWNVEFFKKNGYTVTGTPEGFPKGHTMYLTQKFL